MNIQNIVDNKKNVPSESKRELLKMLSNKKKLGMDIMKTEKVKDLLNLLKN